MPQRAPPPLKPQKAPSKVKLPAKTKQTLAPATTSSWKHNKSNTQTIALFSLPSSLQQSILTLFRTTLSLTPSSLLAIRSTIQSIKSALYARDFATAFGNEDFLKAYAARWSPSRALGYAQLLIAASRTLGLELGQLEEDDGGRVRNVVCLGGGAGAELVGFGAAWTNVCSDEMMDFDAVLTETQDQRSDAQLRLHLVDSAAWGPVLETLSTGLEALPPADGRARLEYQFHQIDLLFADSSEALQAVLKDADLVTLFFTLNELYAASLPLTTKLLLQLGQWVKPGARLCVVDSAGSYAGVTFDHGIDEEDAESDTKSIGTNTTDSTKRYPMAWMLNHTMLELAGKDKNKVWKKILSDESRWFRRDRGSEYPLQLEDMRYQVHIYQRL